MHEGSATRSSQASLSAALAAANAAARTAIQSDARFPGEDGGRSLAEMAYRDLDATLQLLSDRAQYITGSTGAAIALRRLGKNDMLCRASSGSNAPELGALLSAEFGLSGESVRTRQALRCDDTERDVRVNREVCRQMGIASVVVMPVVHDDEVLGVFELFSGKVNAFGERDLSALQRLSEMVETAVKLAHAVQELPERLKASGSAAQSAMEVSARNVAGEILVEPILEVDEDEILEAFEPEVRVEAQSNEVQNDAKVEAFSPARSEVATGPESDVQSVAPERTPIVTTHEVQATAEEAVTATLREPATTLPAEVSAAPVAQNNGESDAATAGPAKKPFLWSAAGVGEEAQKPAEIDQTHVPPVLRNLRKCEACGFPVSAGRTFCVECEEKKWRGQLRVPQAGSRPNSSTAASAVSSSAKVPAAPGPSLSGTLTGLSISSTPDSLPTARAFAAAAQSVAAPQNSAAVSAAGSVATPATSSSTTSSSTSSTPAPAKEKEIQKPPATGDSSKLFSTSTSTSTPAGAAIAPSRPEAKPELNSAAATPKNAPVPELVLSAGLAPSQSWFAANKYIVGALLVVAAVVAAVFLLR